MHVGQYLINNIISFPSSLVSVLRPAALVLCFPSFTRPAFYLQRNRRKDPPLNSITGQANIQEAFVSSQASPRPAQSKEQHDYYEDPIKYASTSLGQCQIELLEQLKFIAYRAISYLEALHDGRACCLWSISHTSRKGASQ
jgi:hypothetical protein